jgi:hypothetical protein
VSFDAVHLKGPKATAWLESMKANYNFRGQLDLVVPITRLDMKPGTDHVFVFEFQPKSYRPIERVVTGVATDRTVR